MLRQGKDDNPVLSEFWIHLPFPVEEQLTNVQVPLPTYTTTTTEGVKILAIELMGICSNYQTTKVVKEYESPPRPMTGMSHTSTAGAMEAQRQAQLAQQQQEQQRQAQLAQQQQEQQRQAQLAQQQQAGQQQAGQQQHTQQQLAEIARQNAASAAMMRQQQRAQQQVEQEQEQQAVVVGAGGGATTISLGTSKGKPAFLKDIRPASIRKQANWMLHLASSHANVEKALERLQRNNEQGN